MDKFVPAFEDFLDLNRKILDTWKEVKGGSKKDPILRSFKRFNGTVFPMSHETHMEEVKAVFNTEYKRIFQNEADPLDDAWITNQNGKNIKLTFGDQKNCCLMISLIYERANILSNEADAMVNEQCGDDPDQSVIDEIENNYPELDYPDKYLLSLYTVFETTQGRAVKSKLATRIKAFKEALRILPVSGRDPSAMMGVFGNLIKSCGFDTSSMQMPDAEQIPDMIQKFAGGDMQNLLSGVIENFTRSGDFAEGARLTAEEASSGKYDKIFSQSAFGEQMKEVSKQMIKTGELTDCLQSPLGIQGTNDSSSIDDDCSDDCSDDFLEEEVIEN